MSRSFTKTRGFARLGQIGLMASALVGCAGTRVQTQAPSPAPAPLERHPPAWMEGIVAHLPNIRACTVGNLPPVGVVFVQALGIGASGITLVDGLGVTEHCWAEDGWVQEREPGRMTAEDLRSLAVFSLERPRLPPLSLVEELIEDGQTLGFVHWHAEADGTVPSIDAKGEEHASR